MYDHDLKVGAIRTLRKNGWNDIEISIVLGFKTVASLRRFYDYVASEVLPPLNDDVAVRWVDRRDAMTKSVDDTKANK